MQSLRGRSHSFTLHQIPKIKYERRRRADMLLGGFSSLLWHFCSLRSFSAEFREMRCDKIKPAPRIVFKSFAQNFHTRILCKDYHQNAITELFAIIMKINNELHISTSDMAQMKFSVSEKVLHFEWLCTPQLIIYHWQ